MNKKVDPKVVLLFAHKDGEHVVASYGSPYFLFTGKSEAEVVAKAQAALRFYESLPAGMAEVGAKTQVLTTVSPYKVLSRSELQAA